MRRGRRGVPPSTTTERADTPPTRWAPGASLTLTFDDGERVAMAPYGLDQFAFTARRTMGYEVSALFFATADGRPEFLATRVGVARWVR